MIKIKIKGARGPGTPTIANIIFDTLAHHGFAVDIDDGNESSVRITYTDVIKSIMDRESIEIKVVNK